MLCVKCAGMSIADFVDRLESKILIVTLAWGCHEVVGVMTDQNFLFRKRLLFSHLAGCDIDRDVLDNLLTPEESFLGASHIRCPL
jgi:hypothetical protein